MQVFDKKQILFEVRGLRSEPFQAVGIGVVFYGESGILVVDSYTTDYNRQGHVLRTFQGGGDHAGNFLEAVRCRNSELLTADIEQGHLSSVLCHLGNISYRTGRQVPSGSLAVTRTDASHSPLHHKVGTRNC